MRELTASMVPMPRAWQVACSVLLSKAAVTTAAAWLLCLGMAASAAAQGAGMHYQHHGAMPPGAIGSWQLRRGGPLAGYFQPVEIKAPAGASISLALEGRFDSPAASPVTVGLLIGQVYRLKTIGIPGHEGAEVFPTIEVIDRIYPPVGQEWRFPIEVELATRDMELALSGKFVTRVIYLENPREAVPTSAPGGEQAWFDATAGENPLQVADSLGRPVAILRMGGRLPADSVQPDMQFLFGCPTWQRSVRYAPAPGMLPAEFLPPGMPMGLAPTANMTNNRAEPTRR